jgi:hypothetical protein
MSKAHSDPPRPILPKWTVFAVLLTTPFAIVGLIVARLDGSTTPNPTTGQVYETFFAKSQSYWYLDLEHFIIYQALTIPTVCAWFIAAGMILYGLIKKMWRR